MKKLLKNKGSLYKLEKIDLKMRLSILLIFTTFFTLQAREFYGQNTKVSLELNNVTIRHFIDQVESTTDFRFVYKVNDVNLDRIISVSANEEEIVKVLERIFKNTTTTFNFSRELIYLVQNKTVAITNKAKAIQNIINGKVFDNNGLPLPGVTVLEKGTNNGTTTDFDGAFVINIQNSNSILVFSHLGYKVNEVLLTSDTNIEVQLIEDYVALDEVIAIGYGRAKKKDITGAVSTIDGETIVKRNNTQLSQSLQGTMPGVMVNRTSSEPGASAEIRVRGITTIGDNDPLIIVDGVPVSDIDNINSEDVENISVLKDAASASIYGARAAAGVLLITTKRAKVGKSSIEYTIDTGVDVPTSFPTMVGPQRYMEMINEFTWNDSGNAAGGEYPLYSQDEVENWLDLNKENPNKYPITDWKDLIVNDYALRNSHALSFNGGSESLKSRASLNYETVGALYDHKSYTRVMGRVNNNYKINDKLSAQLDFSYSHEKRKSPSINPIQSAQRYPSVFAATWADGRIAEGQNGSNIYARLHFGGSENITRNKLNARIAIDYKILDNLSVTGVFAPYVYNTKGKTFNKQISYYDSEDPTIFSGYIAGADNTNLYESRNDGWTITNQLLLNYDEKFGNHQFSVLAGYEGYSTFYESLDAQGLNYTLSNYPYLDLAPLDFMSNSGNAIETAYSSLFGRVMYDYNQKYLIQANVRYDGSSRFHPDYRWGVFPSLSAGWVLTQESFIPKNKVLSFLKLKASWGQLGNERIGNYPYQSTIGYSNALFYEGDKVVSATTSAQYAYAMRDISWETTETKNIGLESYLFNNRVMFTFDYYEKTTKDMLLELEIPDYMGFENPNQNTGNMYTNGWDAQISWRDNIGNFKYSINVNVSDFESKMGDLGGIVFQGSQITREGTGFNEWYGYVSDGLFQTDQEIENAPKLYNSVKPGDVKYKDISGPEGVPDGLISPDYDRVTLGSSQPEFLYGGVIDMQYKGFDLNLSFQGVGKQNSRLTTQMVKPFISAWTNAPAIIDDNYWSVYNTPEENLNAQYPRLSYTGAENNNYEMSDFWLIDGGYFRLKNIVLGYTIPESTFNKKGISSIRVYASATDLFTINNYPKGWDPEVSDNTYMASSFLIGTTFKF
ncbi:SusC/RagA family TonB-linked outer membrane protein [Formosa sp. 3Alg 14/1]|uniref:SusC/RagA family TonB-linked outer membrane protein n=1 Tax=unclassified Formosa TaxID=2644710 RepID=UPI0039BDEC67